MPRVASSRVRHRQAAPDVATGAASGAICNAVVAALKLRCGKGPPKVKAHMCEHRITVVAEEVLTTFEKTLLEAGHAEMIGDARRAIDGEIAQQCRQPIEHATGWRVMGWHSAIDPGADRLVTSVRLEPSARPSQR